MFLPNRLKICRKKRNLSIERVAALLDKECDFKTTRQTLYNWESGAINPSIPGLEALSKFYNVPMSYFFKL